MIVISSMYTAPHDRSSITVKTDDKGSERSYLAGGSLYDDKVLSPHAIGVCIETQEERKRSGTDTNVNINNASMSLKC